MLMLKRTAIELKIALKCYLGGNTGSKKATDPKISTILLCSHHTYKYIT